MASLILNYRRIEARE